MRQRIRAWVTFSYDATREQDAGFRTLLIQFATHGMKRKERRAFEKRWRKAKSRGLPSNAAIHRYLPQFHSPEEEKNRVEGEAFIPKQHDKLKALLGLRKRLNRVWPYKVMK
jgi:hypothetical protein